MSRGRGTVVLLGTLASAAIAFGFTGGPKVGINVRLAAEVSEDALDELARHGTILNFFPEIGAVLLQAPADELPAIQALACVADANLDRERNFAGHDEGPAGSDFAAGADTWSLDAIDVTDFGVGRTVEFDGTGVYVAVIDNGLPHNWRDYFPEERIDTVHARAFLGGGGNRGEITSEPRMWEHETQEHGAGITSVILGFHYSGPEALPAEFNGVAPRATVIPIKFSPNWHDGGAWSSVVTHALLYVTALKTSGELGDAPLVVHLSFGGPDPDIVERAAIDYAIANGVVIVAAAANQGAAGMWYPGAYAPVISAANAGWNAMFPDDDPTLIEWVARDVPEDDPSQYFLSPDSSRELPGQDLDVSAPGALVPAAWTQTGTADYHFFSGTSAAAPHVAGVAALMLQKNPYLTTAQIESILESTAMPLAPGSADVNAPGVGHGNFPTWSDHDNLFVFPVTLSWDADAIGHGLLQADAALAATPPP